MTNRQRLRLIIVLGVLASPDGVAAQGTAIGVKGGANLANVTFDLAVGSGGHTGVIGGGFVTFVGSGPVAFQMEVLYAQRGFSVGGSPETSSVAAFSYIDFPLLVKVPLLKSTGRIQPSLLAGAFFGFELSCTTAGRIAELEGDDDCDALLRGRGETDAGLVLGGSVDFGISHRLFLVLDGRYNLGLLNLNWETQSDSVRSRAWSLMGGLGLLLG